MTDPTPHGQVPEALIDLIDTYAETRHRYGRIHNAKAAAMAYVKRHLAQQQKDPS